MYVDVCICMCIYIYIYIYIYMYIGGTEASGAGYVSAAGGKVDLLRGHAHGQSETLTCAKPSCFTVFIRNHILL